MKCYKQYRLWSNDRKPDHSVISVTYRACVCVWPVFIQWISVGGHTPLIHTPAFRWPLHHHQLVKYTDHVTRAAHTREFQLCIVVLTHSFRRGGRGHTTVGFVYGELAARCAIGFRILDLYQSMYLLLLEPEQSLCQTEAEYVIKFSQFTVTVLWPGSRTWKN